MAELHPDPVPLRVADLLQAAEITGGDRERDYGEPVERFEQVAAIFNAWSGRDLTAYEAAMFMVCLKMARMHMSPLKADHYVDGMAYFGIAHEVAEAEHQRGE